VWKLFRQSEALLHREGCEHKEAARISMNSWDGIITEFTAHSGLKSGENPHDAFIRKAPPESLLGVFLSISNNTAQGGDTHAFL